MCVYRFVSIIVYAYVFCVVSVVWFVFCRFSFSTLILLVGSFDLLNRLPYNLYCVGGDVKHCTIQSNLTDVSEHVFEFVFKTWFHVILAHLLFLTNNVSPSRVCERCCLQRSCQTWRWFYLTTMCSLRSALQVRKPPATCRCTAWWLRRHAALTDNYRVTQLYRYVYIYLVTSEFFSEFAPDSHSLKKLVA